MTPMRSAKGPLLRTIKITLIDVDRLLKPALEEGLRKTNKSFSCVLHHTSSLISLLLLFWAGCCAAAAHASFLCLVVCLFNCVHPLAVHSFRYTFSRTEVPLCVSHLQVVHFNVTILLFDIKKHFYWCKKADILLFDLL